uniref:Tumor necrosis factor receptor superfamily, member 21 n=1 Tax=Petromyzon marinus TaxID=7757 RepID=S4RUA5_PETMA
YWRVDPQSGLEVLCDKCPAGTRVLSHCTANELRVCVACKSGTFLGHENAANGCRRCGPPCGESDGVERAPCTQRHDRVCACPAGWYARDGGCAPHTKCPPGWGVRRRGTETRDVRCKQCSRGTFSSEESSTTRCRPHTDCALLDLHIASPGDGRQDNVCGARLHFQTKNPAYPEGSSASHTHFIFLSDIPITPVGDSAHTFSPQSESGRNMTKLPKRAVPVISGDSTSGEAPTMQARPSLDDVDRRDKASPPSREPPRRWPSLSGSSAANIPPGFSRIPSRSSSGRALAKPPQPPPAPFDINEHVAWLVVVFILLLLVVAVACSVYRSSRALRKGPGEPPETIRQRAVPPHSLTHVRCVHHWLLPSFGAGVDILLLVAGHIGCQWKELYRALLASAASSSSSAAATTAAAEAAYAVLLGWTVLDAEANLARLIGALRTCGWNSLVERIRAIMEDSALVGRVSPVARPSQRSVSPSSCLSAFPALRCGLGGCLVPRPEKGKWFFVDESEPLLRCDSTSSGSSTGSAKAWSFIAKEKRDTILRQVLADSLQLQPIFDDVFSLLSVEELRAVEACGQPDEKLERIFDILGCKSREASQRLLDSLYEHLPELL